MKCYTHTPSGKAIMSVNDFHTFLGCAVSNKEILSKYVSYPSKRWSSSLSSNTSIRYTYKCINAQPLYLDSNYVVLNSRFIEAFKKKGGKVESVDDEALFSVLGMGILPTLQIKTSEGITKITNECVVDFFSSEFYKVILFLNPNAYKLTGVRNNTEKTECIKSNIIVKSLSGRLNVVDSPTGYPYLVSKHGIHVDSHFIKNLCIYGLTITHLNLDDGTFGRYLPSGVLAEPVQRFAIESKLESSKSKLESSADEIQVGCGHQLVDNVQVNNVVSSDVNILSKYSVIHEEHSKTVLDISYEDAFALLKDDIRRLTTRESLLFTVDITDKSYHVEFDKNVYIGKDSIFIYKDLLTMQNAKGDYVHVPFMSRFQYTEVRKELFKITSFVSNYKEVEYFGNKILVPQRSKYIHTNKFGVVCSSVKEPSNCKTPDDAVSVGRVVFSGDCTESILEI
jgi:hypothetical protein